MSLTPFSRHIRLLAYYDRLLTRGPDDEPAIESVEAELERTWDALDAEQRRRAGMIGSWFNRRRRGTKESA